MRYRRPRLQARAGAWLKTIRAKRRCRRAKPQASFGEEHVSGRREFLEAIAALCDALPYLLSPENRAVLDALLSKTGRSPASMRRLH